MCFHGDSFLRLWLVGLSSSHGGLSVGLLEGPRDMASGSPTASDPRERVQGVLSAFYDLVSEVIHHHFCHVTLHSLEAATQVPSHWEARGARRSIRYSLVQWEMQAWAAGQAVDGGPGAGFGICPGGRVN